MKTQEKDLAKVTAVRSLALRGMIYAMVVGLLAVMLGGAGHGWGGARISLCGLLLIPLASLSWVHRRTFGGRSLAIFALACVCATDIDIILSIRLEGLHILGLGKFLFFVWLVLWLVWQVALLVGTLQTVLRHDSEHPSISR